MTITEIRAHLAWMKANPYKVEKGGNFNGIAAIETLLAREAEVLKRLPSKCSADMDAYKFGAATLGDKIRAILNPEENNNG